MSAVNVSSNAFLKKTEWREALDVSLQLLGQAVQANRAYYFEKHTSEDGVALASQIAEWCADDTEPQLENEDLQNVPWIEMGMGRWLDVLTQGDPIHGMVEDFPLSEQEFLEEQGIQSLIAMPVFSRGQFTGLLGFDDCQSLRQWSSQEFNALSAAAGALGAAIERRYLEERLLAAKKMETIGAVTAGIAHDFDNWLLAISMNAKIAKSKIEKGGDADNELAQITLAVENAHGLTRQILDYASQKEAVPTDISLNNLIMRVVAQVEPGLNGSINFTYALSTNDVTLCVDPELICQVLFNLSQNAVQAMPDGGSLKIFCNESVIDSSGYKLPETFDPGEFVQISVQDTGAGMSEQVITRIFEPFYTTKPAGEGTGLGLSIALNSVRQAGGFIEVTSSPNKGSRFDVFLPK